MSHSLFHPARLLTAADLAVKRRSPEGYLETIPEIVVQVRSRNDRNPGIVA